MLYDKLLEMTMDDFKDISAEKINKYCVASLTENEIYTLLEAKTKEVNFSKIGLDNDKTKKSIARTAKRSADLIKKEGINSSTRKTIFRYIGEMYDDILYENKSIVYGYLPDKAIAEIEKYDEKKIQKAFITFTQMYVAQYLLDIVCNILFGPMIGDVLGYVFSAPLTEEAAKQLSIRGGYEKEYFVIFNAFEFSKYVLKFHVSPGLRLISVGFHLSTTIVQVIFNNPKIQKQLGVDLNNRDDVEKVSTIGQVIALFMHGIWNAVCIFS